MTHRVSSSDTLKMSAYIYVRHLTNWFSGLGGEDVSDEDSKEVLLRVVFWVRFFRPGRSGWAFSFGRFLSDKTKGMNISITTTAKNDAEGLALLRQMGMPFRQ